MIEKEKELYSILKKYSEEYEIAFNNMPLGLNFKEINDYLEPYQKNVSKASKEYRLVQEPEFKEEVPEYADLMTMEDFISCCECGGFIDYDGFGEYVKDGKGSGITIYPSDIIAGKYRKDFTHVAWFNR